MKILSPSHSLSLHRGEREKERKEEEEVKILATLEAFSFDAHRIPGRLESLRFPWVFAAIRGKGIEKERGGASRGPPSPLLGGESFFRFTNWFNFFWKSGWTPRKPVVSTPTLGTRLSAAEVEASEGNGLLFGAPGSCRLCYVAPFNRRILLLLLLNWTNPIPLLSARERRAENPIPSRTLLPAYPTTVDVRLRWKTSNCWNFSNFLDQLSRFSKLSSLLFPSKLE